MKTGYHEGDRSDLFCGSPRSLPCTQIDPRLGTNAELAELVDKAHRAGMKVFFDIITNHTADIIQYPIADPGWRCGTPDRPGSIVTSTTVATASLPSSFSLMSVVERTFTFSPSSWCWCDAFNAPAPSAIPAASVSSARNSIKLCVSPPARQFGDEDDPPARFDRVSSGFSSRTLTGSGGWTRNSIKCP